MKKKEDLRILKTRSSLYRGFLKLLEKESFEEIKISDICALSSINRSTFYDHFHDKQELLESFLHDVRDRLNYSLSEISFKNSIRDYFLELLFTLLCHMDKNKKIYSSIIKIPSNSTIKDMLIDCFQVCFLRGIENNIKEDSSSFDDISLFYISGCVSIIVDSFKKNTFSKNNLYTFFTSFLSEDNNLHKKSA